MKHTLGVLALNESDSQSMAEVVDSNWLSPGPRVKAFEETFSSYHDQKHGVMTNSGTDALRIALAALKEKNGWKDGDSVLVPAGTFVATVNVVLQLNLVPRLVDVSKYDFNMDPWCLRQAPMTPDVQCVIPVHLAGLPCDMPKILDVAKDHHLSVLEDSCEAMGVDGIITRELVNEFKLENEQWDVTPKETL